jgi:predicted esterase
MMASNSDIHLRETQAGSKTKAIPKQSAIGVPFEYAPSDDGTDANLLILLHGLGDTHKPFGQLGRQLKLPQTATLALGAPQQIPYLDEPAFQWYRSFDELGELVTAPDPTPALTLLNKVVMHLVTDCGWSPPEIHLFGFAQGGSVAAEFALSWWRTESTSFGSLVTLSGPLLSYPTPSKPCLTPVLVYRRSAAAATEAAAFHKGFSHIKEVIKPGQEGMPRSKDEWEPIMQFWSQRLARLAGEGLYEVLSGMTPPKAS